MFNSANATKVNSIVALNLAFDELNTNDITAIKNRAKEIFTNKYGFAPTFFEWNAQCKEYFGA